MYKLKLNDGTIIDNLERINISTFQCEGDASSPIYNQLSDQNLSFAFLFNGDEIEELLIDYRRQNFTFQNNIIRFRIAPIQELEEAQRKKKIREQKKRRDILYAKRIEDEWKEGKL